MRKRRIILVTEPRLIREMVERAIVKNPGLQIVAEIDSLDRLDAAIRETQADWVILFMAPGQDAAGQVRDLLQAFPQVRFLAIASDGSQVELNWVEFHARSIDRLNLDGLIAILNHEFNPAGAGYNQALGLQLLGDLQGIVHPDR